MIRRREYPRFKRTYSDDEWVAAIAAQGIEDLEKSHERFEELRIDTSESSEKEKDDGGNMLMKESDEEMLVER